MGATGLTISQLNQSTPQSADLFVIERAGTPNTNLALPFSAISAAIVATIPPPVGAAALLVESGAASKISALSTVTTMGGSEVIPFALAGATQAIIFSNLQTAVLAGNAASATKLQTARNINGVAFDGTASITVPAAAGTLTGSTLAAGVTASSLTSVGTLTGLAIAATGTMTWALEANTANALQITDATNPYYAIDTRTGVSGVSVHSFKATGASFAAAAGNTYSMEAIPAFTLTQTGSSAVTAFNGLSLSIDQPTISNASAQTSTTVSTAWIKGPSVSGSAVITNAIGLDMPSFNPGASTTNAACLRLSTPSGGSNQYSMIWTDSGGTKQAGFFAGSNGSGGNAQIGTISNSQFGFFVNNGTCSLCLRTSFQLAIRNDGVFAWTSGTSNALTDSITSGISRLADASLAIGNGSSGDFSGSLKLTTLNLQGQVSAYNAIATAGWGIPAICANGRTTGAVATNASISTYTVGAADGSFEVSANLLVTAAGGGTLNMTMTVSYTDEGGTSRVLTIPFVILAGTTVAAITFAQGAVPYEGIVQHLRCKASTSITLGTTGTIGGATYNAEGIIKQTA